VGTHPHFTTFIMTTWVDLSCRVLDRVSAVRRAEWGGHIKKLSSKESRAKPRRCFICCTLNSTERIEPNVHHGTTNGCLQSLWSSPPPRWLPSGGSDRRSPRYRSQEIHLRFLPAPTLSSTPPRVPPSMSQLALLRSSACQSSTTCRTALILS